MLTFHSRAVLFLPVRSPYLLATAERMEVWIKVREEDYMQLFLVFVAFSSSV